MKGPSSVHLTELTAPLLEEIFGFGHGSKKSEGGLFLPRMWSKKWKRTVLAWKPQFNHRPLTNEDIEVHRLKIKRLPSMFSKDFLGGGCMHWVAL